MAKAAKKSAVPAKKKVVAPVEKKQPNKKAAKKEKVVVKAASPIGALAKYYKAQAVVLDKKLDLMSGHSIFAEPISTGSLVVNYVLSGGIFPIFNQVSGMEGSGKCLVSNTLVKTDLGYVEFGEFISKKGFAPVTGAKIQTPLGIEDYSHTYKEKAATIKIKTGNGFSVEGTADHPMLVIDENLNHAWRKLSEIRVGDWIASVNQQVDLLGTSEEVSLPMATILGNLTANGRGSRFYSFDEKVVERFVEAVMQETGSYPSLVWQPDGKEVSYYNILGRGKGDKGGEGTYYESTLVPLGYKGASSKEKCIPYTVRTSSSKEVLHEFLEAYFECDCGVNGDQIELVTSSPTLSRQLHVILAQEYGVVGKRTVVFSSAANSKKPSVKKYHSIALTGDNAVKFLETFKRAKAHAYLGRFKGKRSNSGGSETDVVPYVRAYTNGVYARRKVGDKPEVSQYVAQDGTILHNFARPNYIKPGVVGYRDNHYVSRKTFEKEDWNNFIPHVDKLCPTLAKKLKALLDQNYRYEKVVSVKAKSKKKWVYDVSVPKSRSFIANGLVSHNTTLMLSTLAHAYNDGVPFIEVTDAEGTIAPEYAANMFKSFNISDIFEEGSTARYYPNEILDTFADKASGILKVMPDKVWLPEANTWAYAVKKGADRRASALVSALRNSGLKEDAALSKQGTGGRWIFPTDYRGPEGLIMVDSWPALMTEKVDEEGQSNQMAGNATPLAKALPRFAGKLRRKGVSLFSINQIRENPGARWGCFQYHTPVLLSDGTTESIGKIVENKMEVEVLSLNRETGKLEPKKVISWFNNGTSHRSEWLTIKTDVVRRGSDGIHFNCTKNHKILTPSGMVPAETLVEGDILYTNVVYRKLSSDQKQMIYGSLLGDGTFGERGQGFEVTWSHSLAQTEYFNLKKQLFSDYVGEKWNNKGSHIVTASNLYVPNFGKLIREVNTSEYVNKVRPRRKSGFSEKHVDKMDIRGFAVYYMDDGTYYESNGSYRISFSAQRLKLEDREYIAARMSEVFKLPFVAVGNRFIRLYGKENCRTFHRAVAPYLTVDMAYKLFDPELADQSYNWSKGNGQLVNATKKCRVISSKELAIEEEIVTKYDIEVEDTHTYIVGGTSGVVVSNSPLYEPGGNTLKHATACRLRMHSRAVPAGESKDPDNGSLGYEKSVTGNGYDYYAYKAVENTKHKMGRPFLKGMIRIWVADVDGVARGIDPMYDTWNYLKTTGQIAGTRANFKFVFRKTITSTSCLALQGTSWKYEELKKLVIAEHFGYKELLKEIAAEKGFNKKPNLRDCLFQQIKNDKDLWSTKELMVEEEDYEDDNYEDDDDE